jgi:signal transduction histidine kinase
MPVTTATRPTLGVAQLPMRRSSTNAILGGVAAGLAVRLGVREQTVRLAFAVSALFGGFGIVIYVLSWMLVARSGEEQSIGARIGTRAHLSWAIPAFNVVIVIVVIGAFVSNSRWPLTSFVSSIIVSLVGVGVVWLGASSEEREHLRLVGSATPGFGTATIRGWRGVFYRVVPAVVLIVIGLNVLNHVGGVWGAAVPALVGAFVLVAGLLVLLAPWWLQTVHDLTNERRERMRMQERATMATQIHDSVLQTLTLIERAAGNESDVVRLARAQERALRTWLFTPEGAGTSPTSFATQASQIEADVEDAYGVRVELVVVGDCEVDDRIEALLGGAREATVNAAKWSEATIISLYAEVEDQMVSMYVRDRGRGFDPESVSADRKGIELSIRARLAQAGGEAVIRSSPGEGTEVELRVPRRLS